MLKDRYIYPALFDYADDGITITYPDLPGCITCGQHDEEAFPMAKEALALHLFGFEEDGEPIPSSTSPKQLSVSNNQAIVLIEVWMPPFRQEMSNQAVKKTLTIPHWLDVVAKEQKVNYSYILQEALKEHLGIQRDPNH